MFELFRKYRFHILAAVALLVALLFYSLNLRTKERLNFFEKTVLNVFSPAQRGATWLGRLTGSVWDDYLNLVDVRKENKELRETIKVLNTRILSNQEAIAANERYKGLLNLKGTLRTPSVASSVIGEDSSPWFRTLVIDRGRSDGLEEGMPVIAAAGIVGRVVNVAANSSRVLLLTDNASAIAAVIQRSRARGVVKGKGGHLCVMEFTTKEEDVKVGDVVVSSGMGGVFPKGLPIGEVAMVKKGEYGIFQTIEIRPAVNLPRLEEVLVLMERQMK